MAITNKTVIHNGEPWLIVEAVDMGVAMDELSIASLMGSVGSTRTENGAVIADVAKLNQDGTRCEPS